MEILPLFDINGFIRHHRPWLLHIHHIFRGSQMRVRRGKRAQARRITFFMEKGFWNAGFDSASYLFGRWAPLHDGRDRCNFGVSRREKTMVDVTLKRKRENMQTKVSGALKKSVMTVAFEERFYVDSSHLKSRREKKVRYSNVLNVP